MFENIICVIPARGKSKGVPGKNMKILSGKPLIWYTIQKGVYLKKQYNINWFVSSDCPITFSYSIMLGGEQVCIRPDDFSKSSSSTASSLLFHCHTEDIPRKAKYIIILQPTTPFTKQQELDKALRLLVQYPQVCSTDGLVSIRKIPQHFHADWQFKLGSLDHNRIERLYTQNQKLVARRQDLLTTYYRSGSLYISSPVLLQQDTILGKRPVGLIADTMGYHVNIDTLDDWQTASSYVRNFRFSY